MPRVRVQSSAQFQEYQRLSKALRQAARGDLQKDLRRQIRLAGQPALAAARLAAQGIDMTSTRGGVAPPDTATGLRSRLARATKLSVTAGGIRFQVREAQVDPRYGAVLTAGSEGARWRHPVFGNRRAWTAQTGSPWFYPTLRSYGPAFRRAAERAMRDTMNKIF